MADRGVAATQLPGFVAHPGQPPLFDKYWDPFWARVQERGLALWMHAGQGERQGELGQTMKRVFNQIEKETGGGGNMGEVVQRVGNEFLKGKVFTSAKPRRAMWQLMMGGVFDRFPKLKLVLSEIYGDWMPPVMKYLDAQYEIHKADLPAKRKPSEYWASNGINGLSFIRKCEVALRHEIGIKQVAFGRDYPHAEGTWPNTKLWLRDALKGLPESEVRDILGENAIRVMGLDRAKLAKIAERVGPTIEEIMGPGPALKPELLAHFNRRGHYSEDPEGETRIPEIGVMLEEDLWRMGAVA
jgi:predicted TIM-barrel fold metal-dependent hydrolase